MNKNQTPETLAAQGGGTIDAQTGAIIPPIHITTTFERAGDLSYPKGLTYGRPDNATVAQAEQIITGLEKGHSTLLFPSGVSAAISLFLALEPPTHIVASQVMYWGLANWLRTAAERYGIETTFVDTTDIDAVSAAIVPGRTKFVWLETPANPLWHVADIAAIAKLAHAGDAMVGVDSTVATPVLTNPLTLGADIVMHSATKYLNGHSDVLAGSLTFKQPTELSERIAHNRHLHGNIIGPFEAAMLIRGMRTLFVRVSHQCQSALQIAKGLSNLSAVEEVLYPGLSSSPQHQRAARQMTGGFGGMLSLRIKGGEQAAIRTAARLNVWKRATSLGGVESLVEHRASIEGPDTRCPSDLLRLSVGLETVSDLLEDLDNALKGNT